MKQRIGPGIIIGFIVILIWCLLPVAWIISLSFKSVAETTSGSPQFLPKSWTIQNYKDILSNNDFLDALRNCALDLALRADADDLQELADAEIERFVIHGALR